MVCRCCVRGCESTGDYDKFSFFNFPTNKERRLEWCQALGRSVQSINSSSRVCLLHFKPTDISQNKSDRPEQYRHSRLMKDAVPCINQVFFETPYVQPLEPPKKKPRKKKKNDISVTSPDDDLSPIHKLIPNTSGMEFLSQIGKLFPVSDEETDTCGTLPISSASNLTLSNSIISTSSLPNSEPKECIESNGEKSLSGAVAYLHSEMFKSLNKQQTKNSKPRKSKRKRSTPNYQEVNHCDDDGGDVKTNTSLFNRESSDQNVIVIRNNCRTALMQLADTIDNISSDEFLGLITNNIDSIAMLCKSHVQKEVANKTSVQEFTNKNNLQPKTKGRPPINKPKRKYTKPNPSPNAVMNIDQRPLQSTVRLSSIKLISLPGPPAMQPSTEISEDFILKPQSFKKEEHLPIDYCNAGVDTSEHCANGNMYTGDNINRNYLSEFSSDPSFSKIPSENNTEVILGVKEEYVDDI